MSDRLPRGDISTAADGSTQVWNASVGRWQAPAPTTAALVRQAPAVAAPSLKQAPPQVPGMVPFGKASRMYAAARGGRATSGFGSSGNSSADAELSTSLTSLRARSRQMIRDSAYAKRARMLVVNNVIGAGVGMQAQTKTTRDALNASVNAEIEAVWGEWACAESCHTGGSLHFSDLERMAMGQVFEAGEVFIRKHYSRFGDSAVPLSLELIEPERLASELVDPAAAAQGAEVRMGVEVDKFGRPLAYWVRERHPGDIRGRVQATDRFERVPAADMFHLRIIDRWPQTRGEPWMHAVLRKIDEMNEYTGSEISAARASSYYFATITTPESNNPIVNDEEDDGKQLMDIEPLTIQELKPGEELNFHSPNRPNSALDPFMRYMLREISAGCGPSYESLSRDYSQGNYSSSRMGLIDDRDLWRVMQQWWLRSFRKPLHATWLQQAVLGQAIGSLTPSMYAADSTRYEAVLFKPRGWTWVDPTKEVAAYKEAIKGGLTTLTDVIAATAGGQDIEDFIATRKRELEMLADAGIVVDTTVTEAAPVATAAPADAQAAAEAADAADTAEAPQPPQRARVVNLARGSA